MDENNQVIPENIAKENIIQTETAPQEAEDVNWKKFREQREIDRKAKEEAERRAKKSQEEAEALKAAMESLLNKQQPSAQYQETDPDFDDEDTKIQKKIDAALKVRDRQYEEQRRQQDQQLLPQRLKQNLPDFDNVCTEENLDYLEYHHPNIAKSFSQMNEGYEKWAGVYDVVKKLVPNSNSKKDVQRAEKNLSKPQSMTRPGMGGTGDNPPYILDEDRKKANWARMERIKKGLA